MDHPFSVQYPKEISNAAKLEIAEFFQEFYQISDIPGEHNQYVDMFTSDATFILASKRAVGRNEILPMRLGMWSAVASRKHTVANISSFGNRPLEFMLYGSVALGLKNGANAEVDWAARAEMFKSTDDEKYRMKFYQVYLDTGAVAAYNKS